MKKTTTLVGLFAAVALFVAGGQQAHAQAATPAAQPNIVEIKPGDNLSKIATAHNSTYKRIYDANANIEHPDVVYPGEKVRVPAPDEQLASRELPVAAQPPAPKAAVTTTTQPKTVKAPARASQPRAVKVSSTAPSGSVWDRLAACESGGRWNVNTGNGYYGGLQFSLSSWRAVGGSGYPHQASKSEQIARAQMLQARQGWGAWPACTAKLGIR